jgi:cytochrome c oxidase subunit II
MLAGGSPIAPTFDAHSAGAEAIASLFSQTLIVCGVIFALVTGLVAWCVIRYRARAGSPEPRQMHGNNRFEFAWTLAPILIVTGLLFLTARAMAVSDPAASGPPDLTVVAHQWWWQARYRSGAMAANEIHIPVGRKLSVALVSADVIHDFWVPQLARKIDVTPGYPTRVTLEADSPGEYAGTCAEYCGAQHAWMRFVVVAEPVAQFDTWERHQLEPAPAPTTPAGIRGAREFRDRTCSQCHAIAEGQRADQSPTAPPQAAPDLTHLASRTTLAAGVLDNTPEGLSAWLTDPQTIKPGCHMPSLKLSQEQVSDLVAYFETLR